MILNNARLFKNGKFFINNQIKQSSIILKKQIMRFLFFLFFFISFYSYSKVEFSDVIRKKVVKTIKQYFDSEECAYNPISSVPGLGLQENHVFQIFNNEENIGYFALEQSMGQYDNFDYLVLFDQNLEIVAVKIITYREDYGYEISSKWWLSQFIGKKAGKDMKYKENIKMHKIVKSQF